MSSPCGPYTCSPQPWPGPFWFHLFSCHSCIVRAGGRCSTCGELIWGSLCAGTRLERALGSPLRGTLPPLPSLRSDLPTLRLFLQGMTLPSPSFPDALSSSYHITRPSPQINIHRSFPFMLNSSTIKAPLGRARAFRARLRRGPPRPADSHSVLTQAGPGTGSALLCAYTLPASSAAHASPSGVSC